jgi:hypothetical protein
MDSRYKRINAANKIDGYYTPPRSVEGVEFAFLKAKSELLTHLRDEIEFIEQMSVSDFIGGRKGK